MSTSDEKQPATDSMGEGGENQWQIGEPQGLEGPTDQEQKKIEDALSVEPVPLGQNPDSKGWMVDKQAQFSLPFLLLVAITVWGMDIRDVEIVKFSQRLVAANILIYSVRISGMKEILVEILGLVRGRKKK